MHWLATLAVAFFSWLPPSGGRMQRFEAVEPHMGTLVQVIVYTQDEREAKLAFRTAFDRIRELDRTLSDYRLDSELNDITKKAVGRPVPVSADLFEVLQVSQQLAEETAGAFDITQGPVVRLWRQARTTGHLPVAAELTRAMARSGFRKLHLDRLRHTVMLDVPDMALDVGAIGKGYAASEAIQALTARQVRSALVAISGDLAFSDAPPGQRGWRVGIHSLDTSLTSVPSVLELTNAAVSTSGNAEQHLDADGRRYSHIIDPRSGDALVEDVTVTVIAPHGIDADGLDTAVSVLGPKRGLELIEAHPDAAALIARRNTAGTRVLPSSRLVRLLDHQSQQSH